MERCLPFALEVSPFEIRPPVHWARQLPINELGAADFHSILRGVEGEDAGTAEALRGLLRDVAEDRIVYPVIVRRNRHPEELPYQLVSGWLVWSAAIHCGRETVRALLWEGGDVDALAMAYRLNQNRLQMKQAELGRLARFMANLLSEDGREATYRDVAAALGCSLSWAHKLLHQRPPLDDDDGSLPETEAESRGRGRPPVTPILRFHLVDPEGWQSSVRLRVVLLGKGSARELRLERSEEGEDWRPLTPNEFFEALSTEIGRIENWLGSKTEGEDFFLRKNGRNGIRPASCGAHDALRVAEAREVPRHHA